MNNIISGSQISSHILAPFFALKDINFDEGNILCHRDPSKEKKKTIRMPKLKLAFVSIVIPSVLLEGFIALQIPILISGLILQGCISFRYRISTEKNIISILGSRLFRLWRKSASKEYPRIVNDVKTTLEFFLLPYLALTLVCR